jgi:hypothetical protein
MSDGIVDIRGKQYHTVQKRVVDFRKDHPGWAILTEVLTEGDLVKVRAEIRDDQDRVLAIGHAEEDRTLGNINKTSAVENAETSAVGRALAFLGYGGTYIRSAEEMETAQYQAESMSHIEYVALVRERWDHINAIKELLSQDNIDGAREVYKELEPEEQIKIWKAPTKGGILTTLERQLLKEGKRG